MITKKKIEIFRQYEGEVDAFGHGRRKDRQMLSDDEFLFMVRLRQDVLLVKRQHASLDFASKLEESLRDNFDSQESINLFLNYIK